MKRLPDDDRPTWPIVCVPWQIFEVYSLRYGNGSIDERMLVLRKTRKHTSGSFVRPLRTLRPTNADKTPSLVFTNCYQEGSYQGLCVEFFAETPTSFEEVAPGNTQGPQSLLRLMVGKHPTKKPPRWDFATRARRLTLEEASPFVPVVTELLEDFTRAAKRYGRMVELQ